MPTPVHDSLNGLFRNRPAFAAEILRNTFQIDLPTDTHIEVAAADFNDRLSIDFHADTVIIVGPRLSPAYAIIVEIQQQKVEEKRPMWARYAAALWLQVKCPVVLLVCCPTDRVAAWAEEPVVTQLDSFVLHPRVLGPRQIPPITDPGEALECLELATMSVMVHGAQREVSESFMTALAKVEVGDAVQYYEYAFRLASTDVRRFLEDMVSSTTWPVYSPFAKEHYGHGHSDGRAEGKAEGKAEGEVAMLLIMLKARGIAVTAEAEARIVECTDLSRLAHWGERASIATTLGEVFDD
jgi:hypothetical protein